jgi:hypothetical protein
MNEHLQNVIPHQPHGNAARLCGRFALHVDKKRCVDKRGRFLHRKQSDASTNRYAHAQRCGKTNFVQAVVDAHRQTRADVDCLFHPVTQQRKREKAMSNCAAEGRFALSALGIQMNPLVVLGGIGKFLDAILRDDEPICRGEFASFELLQRIQILNFKRWHRSFL